VFLKRAEEIEITGHEIGSAGRVIHNLPAVGPAAVTSQVGGMDPNDLYFFGPLKKHLAVKWFERDAVLNQAVTSWLQITQIDFFHSGIQTLVPRKGKRFKANSECVKCDVYHVLPCARIRLSQNKIFVFECSVHYFS
jgi:hypothetical protein